MHYEHYATTNHLSYFIQSDRLGCVLKVMCVVFKINHQVKTTPTPSDRYTRRFLTGRPRVFSLFIALTYAITSPT